MWGFPVAARYGSRTSGCDLRGCVGEGLGWTWGSRLSIMWFVRTTGSQAAAAVRIGVRLAERKQAELLEGMRCCFRRVEPFVQARKYVRAVLSELPKRNGWSIAEHVGDRTPDRTQRLLNRASWDDTAAMAEVRRFAVSGLEQAARKAGRRRGRLVIGALDETGQEKKGESTAGVKRQHGGCRTGWWSKRRWQCQEPGCSRASLPSRWGRIPSRSRVTGRLRAAAGNAVALGVMRWCRATQDTGLSSATITTPELPSISVT